MAFWTWGRELEESFDNANNQKLSRIIVNSTPSDPIKVALPSSPMTGHVDEELELHTVLEGQSDPQEEEVDQELNDQSDLYLKKPDGDLLKLERIPVMAIFHRNDSAGKGVPHSFASFLQRYPALPQVVVSTFSPSPDPDVLTSAPDLPVHSSRRYPLRTPRRPVHHQQSAIRPRLLHHHNAVSLALSQILTYTSDSSQDGIPRSRSTLCLRDPPNPHRPGSSLFILNHSHRSHPSRERDDDARRSVILAHLADDSLEGVVVGEAAPGGGGVWPSEGGLPRSRKRTGRCE